VAGSNPISMGAAAAEDAAVAAPEAADEGASVGRGGEPPVCIGAEDAHP
jgi:hypothetical protein